MVMSINAALGMISRSQWTNVTELVEISNCVVEDKETEILEKLKTNLLYTCMLNV